MTWDAALRLALGAGLGLLVAALGVAVGAPAVRDLRIRLRGRSAIATVVRTEAEPVTDERLFHDWTVVEFRTEAGDVLHDVRLRSWSSAPPRPGRQLRVYYPAGDPRDADRSRLLWTVARLSAVPLLAGIGVLAATAVVVWGPGR